MSDESRKAFEARWKELNPHPTFHREVIMEHAYWGWQARDAELASANARITRFEALIVMYTDFTGQPPYVGDEGLLLALKEALIDRRRKTERLAAIDAEVKADDPLCDGIPLDKSYQEIGKQS